MPSQLTKTKIKNGNTFLTRNIKSLKTYLNKYLLNMTDLFLFLGDAFGWDCWVLDVDEEDRKDVVRDDEEEDEKNGL